jgi:hypothetical protein
MRRPIWERSTCKPSSRGLFELIDEFMQPTHKVKKIRVNKPNGSIHRYKAQLVAKGFDQMIGVVYHETFSPVIKPTSIQLVSVKVHGLYLLSKYALREEGCSWLIKSTRQ